MIVYSCSAVNRCYKVSVKCPVCGDDGIVIYSPETGKRYSSLPVRHGSKICRVKVEELKKAIKPYLAINE
ncbi:MAG: hypothetical protein R6U44_10820 [Archaeoglobaceae archaeon]